MLLLASYSKLAWVKSFCVGPKFFRWSRFIYWTRLFYYTTTNCFASLFPTNLDQALFGLFSIFEWLNTKGVSRNPAPFYMKFFVTLTLKQSHKELSFECCKVLYTLINAINLILLVNMHSQTNSFMTFNKPQLKKQHMD